MSNVSKQVDDFLNRFPPESADGYLYWPLPCPLDEELSRIVRTFADLPSNERDKVSESFHVRYSDVLRAFAERMAILGVRENSSERLFDGLVALVIENFRLDYRETLLVLSLLYHSAVKISADPEDLLARAESLAAPEAAKLLRVFIQDPSSIDEMGYVEGVYEGDFWYYRTW